MPVLCAEGLGDFVTGIQITNGTQIMTVSLPESFQGERENQHSQGHIKLLVRLHHWKPFVYLNGSRCNN